MRVTAWLVCVIAGRIEVLSGGPGVDVALEMADDLDSICTAFDMVRRNGRIVLLATEEFPKCRLTVEIPI
jgi:threonine dehydrogenase-like Zn-dependent dehydrogenase